MRTLSAASAKKRRQTQNMVPSSGTKLRNLYDKLQAKKGRIITLRNLTHTEHTYLYCVLPDYYGLDIRNFGKGRYCLVGEWFGTNYVDYLAKEGKK